MTPEVLIALIGAIATVLSAIVSVNVSTKRVSDLVEYRISQLEVAQTKHNQLVERTFKLEKDVAVLNEKISELEE